MEGNPKMLGEVESKMHVSTRDVCIGSSYPRRFSRVCEGTWKVPELCCLFIVLHRCQAS